MIKRLVLFICVIGLSILTESTYIYAKDVPGVTKNSIKIGVILDQTGPVANLMGPAVQAIRSYFRNTNDLGGINGREIQLVVEDDHFVIPMMISAFKKLVFKNKVFLVIGPTATGGLMALRRSIEKERVPLMTLLSPEIAVNPFQRYIFVVQDIYPNQMKVLVDYMIKDRNPKGPRIGVVYPDSETGKVDLKATLERLKSYNISLASKQVFNTGSVDASSQVMNLKKDKVDHVIFPGSIVQTTVVLLRDFKKYGLNVTAFGSWATCGEAVMEMAGDAAKQFFVVNAINSWYDEGPALANMREVTLKYYPGTEKPYRVKMYTQAWLLSTLIEEGLKRSGREFNRESFIDKMETIKDFDTGGLSGHINYSSTSHKGGDTWKIFKADLATEKFIPMTGWRKPD